MLTAAIFHVLVRRNNLILHTTKNFAIALTVSLFILHVASYFNEFESSEVLKDLFEKPLWSYASSYEIKGVFVEIRNFLDEIINYLCQQCSIGYDQYTYFSKKFSH